MLFGQVFKLGAFFQAGHDGFGLVFLFHQDVAGAVLFAAIGRHEFVVLGLDVGVGDLVFVLLVVEQLANQNRLACQFQLVFVFVGRVQPTAHGFLHEDFAVDDFFFDLRFQIRCHGTA